MVRVLIASGDNELFNAINRGLSMERSIEMIINVGRVTDAENKLSRQSINVLVLDLDYGTCTSDYLQQMCRRYKLQIILTSSSSLRANLLLKGDIRDFIPKPLSYSNILGATFVKTILNRISGFMRENAPLDYRQALTNVDSNSKIIAMASSTGGTEALEKIFRALPSDMPPILVVQHMPSGFTKLFADRLDGFCNLTIKEAQPNDYLRRGLVLIAPADYHMVLIRQNGKLAVDCYKGVKVHGVMPAADILFDSVAEISRQNALGVILTGMGADGAKGLLLMRKNGAKTIGQNQASCVVYGMPKVARDLGAVEKELPLDMIADAMQNAFK